MPCVYLPGPAPAVTVANTTDLGTTPSTPREGEAGMLEEEDKVYLCPVSPPRQEEGRGPALLLTPLQIGGGGAQGAGWVSPHCRRRDVLPTLMLAVEPRM
jgi:hypothetical protein